MIILEVLFLLILGALSYAPYVLVFALLFGFYGVPLIRAVMGWEAMPRR
jgi:hypothetical protein